MLSKLQNAIVKHKKQCALLAFIAFIIIATFIKEEPNAVAASTENINEGQEAAVSNEPTISQPPPVPQQEVDFVLDCKKLNSRFNELYTVFLLNNGKTIFVYSNDGKRNLDLASIARHRDVNDDYYQFSWVERLIPTAYPQPESAWISRSSLNLWKGVKSGLSSNYDCKKREDTSNADQEYLDIMAEIEAALNLQKEKRSQELRDRKI